MIYNPKRLIKHDGYVKKQFQLKKKFGVQGKYYHFFKFLL